MVSWPASSLHAEERSPLDLTPGTGGLTGRGTAGWAFTQGRIGAGEFDEIRASELFDTAVLVPAHPATATSTPAADAATRCALARIATASPPSGQHRCRRVVASHRGYDAPARRRVPQLITSGMLARVSMSFPDPTLPVPSREQVF